MISIIYVNSFIFAFYIFASINSTSSPTSWFTSSGLLNVGTTLRSISLACSSSPFSQTSLSILNFSRIASVGNGLSFSLKMRSFSVLSSSSVLTRSSSYSFSPGRSPVSTILILFAPDRWIIFSARSSILIGFPMSRTSSSPL